MVPWEGERDTASEDTLAFPNVSSYAVSHSHSKENVSGYACNHVSRSLSVPVSSWTPLPIILPSNHMHQSPIATHTCRSLPGLFKTHTHTRPLAKSWFAPVITSERFLVDCISVAIGLFIGLCLFAACPDPCLLLGLCLFAACPDHCLWLYSACLPPASTIACPCLCLCLCPCLLWCLS